jgi:hypothetical protein
MSVAVGSIGDSTWGTNMRVIASLAAMLLIAGPVAAQNWQDYSYPDYSFRVSFPADPQIETTTYPLADDLSVQARVYSIRQDNSSLKLTVAELAGSSLQEAIPLAWQLRR